MPRPTKPGPERRRDWAAGPELPGGPPSPPRPQGMPLAQCSGCQRDSPVDVDLCSSASWLAAPLTEPWVGPDETIDGRVRMGLTTGPVAVCRPGSGSARDAAMVPGRSEPVAAYGLVGIGRAARRAGPARTT
jgi:hypothetical protein